MFAEYAFGSFPADTSPVSPVPVFVFSVDVFVVIVVFVMFALATFVVGAGWQADMAPIAASARIKDGVLSAEIFIDLSLLFLERKGGRFEF